MLSTFIQRNNRPQTPTDNAGESNQIAPIRAVGLIQALALPSVAGRYADFR